MARIEYSARKNDIAPSVMLRAIPDIAQSPHPASQPMQTARSDQTRDSQKGNQISDQRKITARGVGTRVIAR